ncbi:YncE family protein [Labrenzia sp. DG1229]|uniref:YncE family protein n=1 Tax=Labrenzia sp. DG1229 TaxID=681847 RepID=UPI00048A5569|nr:YncE family protein [Labrenzia sp. DG1229]
MSFTRYLITTVSTVCLVAGTALSASAATLIVGNKYAGTVSFIDLESGQEVKRPVTGGSPHELALSPDGEQVVVVSYLEDGYIGRELNVFDVATAAHLKTIDISPHMAPHGIAWLGDTDSVIVTTEETRDVITVDVVKGTVTGQAEPGLIGTHLLALSPDFSTAYVTSRGSDKVSVVDAETMKITHTASTDVGPEAVDVSPDGKQLWVGNNQSETIIVFDPQTMERQEVIEAGFLPIRVRFHPEGQAVAVADLRGDRVVVYESGNREVKAEIDLAPHGAYGPASLLFSPDGNSLFVGAQDGARVAEIDTSSWSVIRVIETDEGADGLAYSDMKVSV